MIKDLNMNYRCSAPVGWKPERGRIDVSLGGRNCLSRRGTVQHELLHALGFWHEHSRTDRDLNILIQWDNILKGECINNTSTPHMDAQNQYFTLISLMIPSRELLQNFSRRKRTRSIKANTTWRHAVNPKASKKHRFNERSNSLSSKARRRAAFGMSPARRPSNNYSIVE